MNKQKNKDEIIVNEKFLTKAKKLIGKIPFLQNSIELYYCATDENTENWVKVLSFSALAYFVIPFDAIPDLIPIMGYTDDATIIAAAIKKLVNEITDEHKKKAEDFLKKNSYKNE